MRRFEAGELYAFGGAEGDGEWTLLVTSASERRVTIAEWLGSGGRVWTFSTTHASLSRDLGELCATRVA